MDKDVAKNFGAADFESKIEELRSIAARLENDKSVSIAESMELYQNGIEIARMCVSELEGTQKRIEELNEQLENILVSSVLGDGNE